MEHSVRVETSRLKLFASVCNFQTLSVGFNYVHVLLLSLVIFFDSILKLLMDYIKLPKSDFKKKQI